nr:MAG TPA: hypothetical protein [Bacteriophage sp.]
MSYKRSSSIYDIINKLIIRRILLRFKGFFWNKVFLSFWNQVFLSFRYKWLIWWFIYI